MGEKMVTSKEWKEDFEKVNSVTLKDFETVKQATKAWNRRC